MLHAVAALLTTVAESRHVNASVLCLDSSPLLFAGAGEHTSCMAFSLQPGGGWSAFNF